MGDSSKPSTASASAAPVPGRGGGRTFGRLAGGPPAGGGRDYPVGALFLLAAATGTQVAASILQQGIGVLAVYIREALHLTLAQMGTIVSATSLGLVVGLAVAGALVDLYGPRLLQAVGAAATALALLLVAAAPSYPFLLVALFLLGLFLASVPSSGTRAVFQSFPPQVRGLMMGIRQTGVPVGGALGAVLLSLAVRRFGLHGVWVALAVPILLGAAVFCALAPGPALVGRARSSPLSREFRRSYVPMLLGFLLVAGQYSTITFTLPYLVAVQGWSVALGGVGLAVAQIGGGVGRIGLGVLSDRLGGRRSLVLVLSSFLAAAVALAMAEAPRGLSPFALLPLLFLLGAGTIGWNPLALTWAGELVPSPQAGQAMSWAASVIFLGSALYPPLFGHVVDLTRSYGLSWGLLAALLGTAGLLGLVALRLLGRPRLQDVPPPAAGAD